VLVYARAPAGSGLRRVRSTGCCCWPDPAPSAMSRSALRPAYSRTGEHASCGWGWASPCRAGACPRRRRLAALPSGSWPAPTGPPNAQRSPSAASAPLPARAAPTLRCRASLPERPPTTSFEAARASHRVAPAPSCHAAAAALALREPTRISLPQLRGRGAVLDLGSRRRASFKVDRGMPTRGSPSLSRADPELRRVPPTTRHDDEPNVAVVPGPTSGLYCTCRGPWGRRMCP